MFSPLRASAQLRTSLSVQPKLPNGMKEGEGGASMHPKPCQAVSSQGASGDIDRARRLDQSSPALLATDTRLWPVSWRGPFDRNEACRTSVAIRSAWNTFHVARVCSKIRPAIWQLTLQMIRPSLSESRGLHAKDRRGRKHKHQFRCLHRDGPFQGGLPIHLGLARACSRAST